MDSLKSSYRKQLTTFIIINIIIFWLVFITPVEYSDWSTVFILSVKDFMFLIFPPFITIIMNGILSTTNKTILVFWNFRYPLPGSYAFSKYIFTDHRIDMNTLREKYGEFPENHQEQNRLWYSMLKKNEDETSIKESHRDWLFTRDLTGFSIIFLVIMPSCMLFVDSNYNIKIVYVVMLLLQYFVISKAARTYGIRFVCNVLAVESSKKRVE